jgi:hypothetical protein
VAYLALFVALGGGALAATVLVSPSGRIKGCVNDSGRLRVLQPRKRCSSSETFIAWNQTGPKGTPGKRGAKGEPGAKGETGPEAKNAEHAASADAATNADKLDNIDSSAFAPVGSEAWHTPTLNDGFGYFNGGSQPHSNCWWSPYGQPFETPGFFRDPTGVVHLRGFARAHHGDGSHCGGIPDNDSVAFTLPVGYRPESEVVLSTVSNNTPGRLNIRTNGNVEIEPDYPSWFDVTVWVSLDGAFRCAPSGQDGCP